MIRLATQGDLPAIQALFASAREYMHTHGNPNQWTNGYPSDDILRADMAHGWLHVAHDASGEIYGVFVLMDEPEPTYARIDGAWRSDAPYATIHRICSRGGSGLFHEAIVFARTRWNYLRIDTHADNLPMQRAIAREGFRYCGVITLRSGDLRRVFRAAF